MQKMPRNFLIANSHSAVVTLIIGYISYILRKRLTDNDTRFERQVTHVIRIYA